MTDMIDRKAGGGFLTADGRQLEWRGFGLDTAPADAPVIVMLHEGLGCVELWRGFPAALHAATGLGVFAYSRAGYGRSDAADLPKPPYHMTHEAKVVLADVLASIGADKYILLGHSDGGTIAAEYAGRVQDHRIRALILMAPHFFTEAKGLAEIRRAGEAFAKTDLATRMAKYHNDPAATFRGWNDAWLNPDFAAWDVAEVIDYFRIPVLAIQGRDDEYGTDAQIEAITTRSYAPVEVVMLDDCRHSAHLDKPDETIAAISDFTARLVGFENMVVSTAPANQPANPQARSGADMGAGA